MDVGLSISWRAVRRVLLLVVLATVVLSGAACSGSDAGPEDQAVEYAVEFGGLFAGGLRPDLGWEAGDVYVDDGIGCAAVVLVADDGLSVVMLLASSESHTIAEVYAAEPGRIDFISGQVGSRQWVPTPQSPGAIWEGLTADAYRQGAVGFGAHCETVITEPAPPVTSALAASPETAAFSMRPVLGVFAVSPALSDPDQAHPASVDSETGLTVIDDPMTEAYLLEPASGDVYWVGAAFIANADIEGAEAVYLSVGPGSSWVVTPDFTTAGGEKFRTATGLLANEPAGSPTRQIAMVVDGEVLSAVFLAPQVGPEGLEPDSIVIVIGASDEAQQMAVDLAATLQR